MSSSTNTTSIPSPRSSHLTRPPTSAERVRRVRTPNKNGILEIHYPQFAIDSDGVLWKWGEEKYDGISGWYKHSYHHSSQGYKRVGLKDFTPGAKSPYTKTKRFFIHHLVLWAFQGEPESEELCAIFIDGDRKNCKSENLAWLPNSTRAHISAREQMADEYRKLRQQGALKPARHRYTPRKTKITEQMVREIREKSRKGKTFYKLAKEYQITAKTVSDIVNRRTWKKVLARPVKEELIEEEPILEG